MSAIPSKLACLGTWPVPGPEAREKKQMIPVGSGQTLDVIHGEENHVLMSFFVSNDFVHVGKMTIPANGCSDPETHRGDEVLLCLEGTVSIFLPKEGQEEAVSTERYEVRTGERFFIPEGVNHQYFNLTAHICQVLLSVAPEL